MGNKRETAVIIGNRTILWTLRDGAKQSEIVAQYS